MQNRVMLLQSGRRHLLRLVIRLEMARPEITEPILTQNGLQVTLYDGSIGFHRS